MDRKTPVASLEVASYLIFPSVDVSTVSDRRDPGIDRVLPAPGSFVVCVIRIVSQMAALAVSNK